LAGCKRKILDFVVTAIAAVSSIGWTLPGTYKSMEQAPSGAPDALSHVVFEVNGERAIVDRDGLLSVVQGDKVTIVEAYLTDRKRVPEHVNLIGFSSDPTKLTEDRGSPFSTLKGFDPKWTVDDDKTVYSIAVTTKKILNGAVFMKIARPTLKFADILVNDSIKVMREGETLVLGATDKVKVKNVVTNLEKNDDVDFEIIKTNDQDLESRHIRKATAFEIRFSRQGQVFAKIPMLVEGL
jgi:hypothetical protein